MDELIHSAVDVALQGGGGMDKLVHSAVAVALETLKKIGFYFYDLVTGTEEKVEALRSELKKLEGWINKFGGKVNPALVKDIKQVAMEAENVIQTYYVNALLQENRDALSKTTHYPRYLIDLASVADKIQRISMRLQGFFENEANIVLDTTHADEISAEDPGKRKAVAVMKDNTVMVGLKEKLKEVIKFLRQRKGKLEFVSIVGMPGSGKTKLAIRVKDDPEISYEFYPCAFVHVSHEYNKKEVFLDILGALKPAHEEMNDKSAEDIRDAIHEELKDKRYMIVMDDVWTEEAWDELKEAFPDNETGSNILLTSRNERVAEHAHKSDYPLISLRDLDKTDAEELLRREVFGENICPSDLLKPHETKIISECSRLPMSIKLIGGILRRGKQSAHWWKAVAESVHQLVAKDEKLIPLIRLSYSNLPEHLKRCFLYLGVFHEGSKIPAWKLLQLWIAEGFVEQDIFSNLEYTAEWYLDDLVARNLVTVEEKRTSGQIKTCSLHDTVRQFCKEEAKRVNFFREIKMLAEASPSFGPDDYFHGLCIHSHVEDYMRKKPSPSHVYVRSFLSFSQEKTNEEIAPSFAKSFKLLRVLDAKSIIFRKFPGELFNFILLTYMSISCESEILPSGVSNLIYLQTLIVRKSQGRLEIPADIWKMLRLRHLHTNVSTILHCPPAEGPTRNIQSLTRISSKSCRDVLRRTPKIKKLGIRGKLEASLFDSVSCLESLEDLRLFGEDPQKGPFPAASKNSFPKKLTKLTLRNTSLDWEYISILADLENLEVLKLKDNAFQGENWGLMTEISFSSLQLLHIGITKLVKWEASKYNFPNLRCLILKDCQKLKGIPSGIGLTRSLQSVYLYDTNKDVAQAALRIERFKKKVKRTFYLSVLPLKHLESESASGNKQVREANEPRVETSQEIEVLENTATPSELASDNKQVREENEPRVEALQEIEVPENTETPSELASDNKQVREENEPRVEASREIEVPKNTKAPCESASDNKQVREANGPRAEASRGIEVSENTEGPSEPAGDKKQAREANEPREVASREVEVLENTETTRVEASEEIEVPKNIKTPSESASDNRQVREENEPRVEVSPEIEVLNNTETTGQVFLKH